MTNKELQQEVNLLRGQVSSLEEEVEGLTDKINARARKKLVSPPPYIVDEQVTAVMERIHQREEARRLVRRTERDVEEVPAPAPPVNYFDDSSWTTVTTSGT